jgi:hypothetical protein
MGAFGFYILIALIGIIPQLGCSSDGWITLFNGQSLDGWQASENKGSWQIEDGSLVGKGPRSHLFYVGDVQNHNFKNFEFMADVKTTSSSNSGIYIHTKYLESGWPNKGYECQVINSYFEGRDVPGGGYVEQKMTGSLYGIRNVWKASVQDNVWFNYHIVVQGKTIQIFINGELVVDYTESDNPYRPERRKERLLSSGTFAFQCHDSQSFVYYKNVKVKPLPDDIPTPGDPTDDPEFAAKLIELADKNFPLMDLHVHLKPGSSVTMDQALNNARKYGFTYGIAINCGLGMGFETDEEVEEYLASYEKPPHTFHAMQAEGREWVDMFSKETVAKFDYVFTDAMTWTNDNGRRMRLWLKEETEIGDPQNFMEQLVDRIETIMSTEPIDIYVNATFIPDDINHLYDELWTVKRMDRVIKALVDNDVALEINDGRSIPSPAFIKRAKAGGVKFTFGTNNAGSAELGKLSYCVEMVKECGLTPNDIWIPRT